MAPPALSFALSLLIDFFRACRTEPRGESYACLTTKCGGWGYVWPPPAIFLALSFLIDVFSSLSAIGILFKENIENLQKLRIQFDVQIKIFPENTFLPYNHLL